VVLFLTVPSGSQRCLNSQRIEISSCLVCVLFSLSVLANKQVWWPSYCMVYEYVGGDNLSCTCCQPVAASSAAAAAARPVSRKMLLCTVAAVASYRPTLD